MLHCILLMLMQPTSMVDMITQLRYCTGVLMLSLLHSRLSDEIDSGRNQSQMKLKVSLNCQMKLIVAEIKVR